MGIDGWMGMDGGWADRRVDAQIDRWMGIDGWMGRLVKCGGKIDRQMKEQRGD